MWIKDDGNSLDYAEKAFAAFNEIMPNSQKDMLGNINSANKGELFVFHFLAVCNTEVLPPELSTALQASTARISALLGALEKKGQIMCNIDKNSRVFFTTSAELMSVSLDSLTKKNWLWL